MLKEANALFVKVDILTLLFQLTENYVCTNNFFWLFPLINYENIYRSQVLHKANITDRNKNILNYWT